MKKNYQEENVTKKIAISLFVEEEKTSKRNGIETRVSQSVIILHFMLCLECLEVRSDKRLLVDE